MTGAPPTCPAGAVTGATAGGVLFLRRRQNQIPATSAAMTATPPTTPPAMAPVGVGFGVGVGGGGTGEVLEEVVVVVEEEEEVEEVEVVVWDVLVELVVEGILCATAK